MKLQDMVATIKTLKEQGKLDAFESTLVFMPDEVKAQWNKAIAEASGPVLSTELSSKLPEVWKSYSAAKSELDSAIAGLNAKFAPRFAEYEALKAQIEAAGFYVDNTGAALPKKSTNKDKDKDKDSGAAGTGSTMQTAWVFTIKTPAGLLDKFTSVKACAAALLDKDVYNPKLDQFGVAAFREALDNDTVTILVTVKQPVLSESDFVELSKTVKSFKALHAMKNAHVRVVSGGTTVFNLNWTEGMEE